MIKALVPIADGSEEMEAVIVIDVLRRAGWSVRIASLDGDLVTGARGVRLQADVLWDEAAVDEFDLLILPGGGPGSERMGGHAGLLGAIRKYAADGRGLAAICAAPLVLQAAGVLENVRATCHPAVADRLISTPFCPERVVEDHNIVTSQGPGTAFEFALALIAKFSGAESAASVQTGLILPE